MTFTPHRWQLEATRAYERLGGVFVGMDVGCGKTWTAAAIARRCERPLIIAPASIIGQTRAMFASYGVPTADARDGADPGAPGVATFASYTWLTRATQADFFERYHPTDVLMDEFHECRRLDSNSCAKRLQRYLVANPAVRVGVFSGSLVTDRLRDYSHGLTWSLRGHVRGLVPPTRAGVEMLEERLEADAAAWGRFQRSLAETPGVFLTTDVGRYDGVVSVRVIRREPALTLPDTWALPDGYLLVSPAQAAEVSRLMAWGAWMRVTPRPSEAYLDARRAWSHVVRGVIGTGAADTEYQVRELRPEAWDAYLDVEQSEPDQTEEPVWETDQAIAWVKEYVWKHLASCTPASSTGTDTPPIVDTARPGRPSTGQSRGGCVSATTVTCATASTQNTYSSAPTEKTNWTRYPNPGKPAASSTGDGAAGSNAAPSSTVTGSDGAPLSTGIARPLLIWVFHVALGNTLSETLGVPFFRERAREPAYGVRLDEARCPVAIASISACAAGLNLQHFNANLWLEFTSDPEVARQGIGRTARQGQLASRVTNDIVVNCESSAAALRTAIARARLSGKPNPILQLDGTDW